MRRLLPAAFAFLLSILPGAGAPFAAETGVVEESPDGDTLRVIIDGARATVRLIGIDAPERNHPTIGKEYYGDESAAFLSSLCLGKSVRLEKGNEDVDRYNRLLRYVFLPPPDGRLLNLEMIRPAWPGLTPAPLFTPRRVRRGGKRGPARRQRALEGRRLCGSEMAGASGPAAWRYTLPEEGPTSCPTGAGCATERNSGTWRGRSNGSFRPARKARTRSSPAGPGSAGTGRSTRPPPPPIPAPFPTPPA
jgi:endonuclease YncB( thermonuclease family)